MLHHFCEVKIQSDYEDPADKILSIKIKTKSGSSLAIKTELYCY